MVEHWLTNVSNQSRKIWRTGTTVSSNLQSNYRHIYATLNGEKLQDEGWKTLPPAHSGLVFIHGTATRVVSLLGFVERLDFLCQFLKPGLNCEIDRILGVLTFYIAFTGFDLCQQLNSFVNGGNR